MNVLKLAAFADGEIGGNPAGVVLGDALPDTETMQSIAADVGYSETAFAARLDKSDEWRVRYFSPESEVPFCGHATIALGAALAEHSGAGVYQLTLNEATISVEGHTQGAGFTAALQSPPTHSRMLDELEIDATLALFGYSKHDLDSGLPPAFIHAGANHYLLALSDRQLLANMHYDLVAGREFMQQRELITIMLVHRDSDQQFNVRNAFASGGVFEDPATGAAAAAFSGYLRDQKWPHGGQINIVQGEDMGSRSLITANFSDAVGESIRVSGSVRVIRHA